MAADERGEAEQAIAGTRDGEAESAADRETRLRSENARLRFDLHKTYDVAYKAAANMYRMSSSYHHYKEIAERAVAAVADQTARVELEQALDPSSHAVPSVDDLAATLSTMPEFPNPPTEPLSTLDLVDGTSLAPVRRATVVPSDPSSARGVKRRASAVVDGSSGRVGAGSVTDVDDNKVSKRPKVVANDGDQATDEVPPSREVEPSDGIPQTCYLRTTLDHGSTVCAVAFDSTSTRLFSGGEGDVKIWDIDGDNISAVPIDTIPCLHGQYVRDLVVDSRNSRMVLCGESNTISIFDIGQDATAIAHLASKENASYAVELSKDNMQVFNCTAGGALERWDIHQQRIIQTFSGHTDAITCAKISHDGTKILTGSLDSTLRVWDFDMGTALAVYTFPSAILSLDICPGNSWVALGLQNSHVEVINVNYHVEVLPLDFKKMCKHQLLFHSGPVLDLDFAATGDWFLSAGADRSVTCWKSLFVPRSLAATAAGSPGSKSPFVASTFSVATDGAVLASRVDPTCNIFATGSDTGLASLYSLLYPSED